MSREGSILPQIIAALGATLGAFSLGTVISWPAITQDNVDSSKCGTDCDVEGVESEDWSQVAALMNIGAAIVPLFAAFTIPYLGKKWTMILMAVPFIGGWLLIFFANSAALFFVGRILTGFSGGCFALAAPAYTNEIAEPKIRGALGSLMQMMVTLGITFIYVFGTFLNWKTLTGICIIFPGLMVLWMFFMPKSPYFLVEKGDIPEARKALQFFRKKDDVTDELEQIKAEVETKTKIGNVSPIALLTKSQYLKPFLIAAAVMLFQQLSGINFVMNYTVTIFQDAGSELDPNVSAIILGIIQVLFTGVAILVVDRFGRKLLLGLSSLIMTVSLCGMGTFFALKENVTAEAPNSTLIFGSDVTQGVATYVSQETVDNLGMLPLISLMLYIAGFSIGFGPLPWVLNVELATAEARSISGALCTSINWLTSYFVVSFTPALTEATSQSTCYFLFAGVCLLGLIFILLVTPETKGKSEDEMREYFSPKK